MSGHHFNLRVAQPADAEAVTAVLASAYRALVASRYDPAVLAATLPAMMRANPGLLASGTYYVQEMQGGRIVACGGWTHAAPGTNTQAEPETNTQAEPGTNKVEDGTAHIRHFGTHTDWIRHGLGTGIFARCRQEALAAGVHTFRCFSSLGAEAFYTALGFRVLERTALTIGGNMKFPTVTMVRTDRPATEE